jgi:hypothetical protein
MGVAVSKLVGVGIGALCVALNRARLIHWINYWYCALILWNLVSILVLDHRVHG